MHAEIAGGI